jgi:hypothetical protein
MPYLIRTPANPRSFLTNNSVIYMDALSWGWSVESLPYGDEYCKTILAEEMEMGESFRRDRELERIWQEEVDRRREAGEVDEMKPEHLERVQEKVVRDGEKYGGRVDVGRPVVGRLSHAGSIIHGWD